jgi:hypothetical protein
MRTRATASSLCRFLSLVSCSSSHSSRPSPTIALLPILSSCASSFGTLPLPSPPVLSVTHPPSLPVPLSVVSRATYWAVHRGYSLWKVLEAVSAVDSIEELYHLLLSLLETGFLFTSQHAEEAQQLCLLNGSLDGLRAQYSWHPAFSTR